MDERQKDFSRDLGVKRALWHAIMNTVGWFIIQILRLPDVVNWLLFAGVGGAVFVADLGRVVLYRFHLAGIRVPKWFMRAEACVVHHGIIREKERKVISAGVMNVAGIAVLYLFNSDEPAVMANCLLWLGWGDPAARLFGIGLGGKHRDWLHGKTVEGCMAFLIFGSLGTLMTWGFNPTHPVYVTADISFFGFCVSATRATATQFMLAVGLFAAMVTEVYSDFLEKYTAKVIRGWDNLLVLTVTSCVMRLFT